MHYTSFDCLRGLVWAAGCQEMGYYRHVDPRWQSSGFSAAEMLNGAFKLELPAKLTKHWGHVLADP